MAGNSLNTYNDDRILAHTGHIYYNGVLSLDDLPHSAYNKWMAP